MNADRQRRDGTVVLVAAVATVGFVGLLLGPSAAILLATLFVIVATVLSHQKDLFAPGDSEVDAAIGDEIVAELVESRQQVPLTGDLATAAAIQVAPMEQVAAAKAPAASPGGRYASYRGIATVKLCGKLVSTSSISTLITVGVAGLLLFMLFADLGNIPAGLFCDEAEIGIRTRELWLNQLRHFHVPLFYHHFSYTNFGTLPLFSFLPFVALLGLSDFSIRMASVFWAIGAVVLLVALVRRLEWSYGEIGVLAFAFSPVFIHVSRVNFAHSPSFFCITVGLYCYARAYDSKQLRWPLVSGVAFGLSVYGNLSYYLATPVILIGLVLGEVINRRLEWRGYRRLAIALLGTAATWIPVLVKFLTDERFTDRFKDKDYSSDPLFSWNRLQTALDNYPKYFGTDYLFTKGESSMPGGFISRHSVIGAGELPWIVLPLVIAGIVATISARAPRTRLFGIIGLTTLVLYPIPDILTTSSLNPPYTLAVFSTMISIPLLAALGAHWLVLRFKSSGGLLLQPRVVSLVMLVIIVVGGVRFYFGPYQDYPNVSAGYYGWQYGPRQATDAFKEYDANYDRFLLDGDFNEAFVFLDFYLADDKELRAKSVVGGLDQATLSRHELFAVRRDRYDALMMSADPIRLYSRVIDVIRYPAGDIDMYLVDISQENYGGRLEMPR